MLVIKGKVGKGTQRGKNLGFPTANIPLAEQIPEGIYISTAEFDGKSYPSLTFIGVARTFENSTYQSETYLLNTNLDLYNKSLKVTLIKKLRENKKFNNPEELIKAMRDDEKSAKKYFKLTS